MLTVRSTTKVKGLRESSPATRGGRARGTQREPEVAGPEVAGPEVAGPEVAGPEVAGPEVAGPEVAGSGAPSRHGTALAILDAAEALLAEGGMRALSARAIAERAGVRKGLVFYYWPNTDALFEEVLGRYYERHAAALAAAFATEGDVRARMHRMIDAYLDFVERHHTYARVVQEQIASGGPYVDLVRAHLSDVLKITARALEGVLPERGARSVQHFHLSLSSLVINYFTYGPVLGRAWWGKEPLGARGLSERREHVHWVIDAWLEKLAAG